MNRRRTLIGIATLVFGASGFVASGAFTTGSQGSLGAGWVQVAGTNEAVSFASPQQLDGLEGSDGSGEEESGSEGTSDTGGDGTDGDETTSVDDGTNTDDGTGGGDDGGTSEDDEVSIRVQVVTDPDNNDNAVNGSGTATWNGTVVPSNVVRGTEDGFFRGMRAPNTNMNATSIVGRLQDGYPNGDAAFIIANVGPDESGAPTGSVSVNATLLADEDVLETEQLRFPYRVVDGSGTTVSRGENLFAAGGVTLADGHVIEVVIVIDTNSGSDELEQLDTIRFTASEVGS
ncbi:hypothetical protein DM826_05630 [Halonotius aquaticus]|uniref:Uncharacterized protein n=2 Tax=Halonotius aquaticus TaxID=2216978 RepID=A0A3A6PT77_9EURY|nr:hypothetical protein DM826_05630 [Halonotius aquaticus]